MPLRTVVEDEPGIRRVRRGRGFSYVWPSGRPVRARSTLERVRGLVIPPAWQDVWICPDARGHIQATGVDEAGRKQYMYHEAWRRARDAEKFDRLAELAKRLPALRRELHADLSGRGLERDRVVAAVVRSLESTFQRVGSERYARRNKAYGVSSVRGRHVDVTKERVRFVFPTKGGKEVEVEVVDARVARVVRACQGLGSGRLFRYIDEEGVVEDVEAGDVNAYLKRALGNGFSAKDLRTWAATVLLASELRDAGPRKTRKERERVLREAVKAVAKRLENTPTVCRTSYLHPAVAAAYVDGSFVERARNGSRRAGLWPEEALTLRILETFSAR